MKKSLLLFFLPALLSAQNAGKLVINVPDPPSAACFINSVALRSFKVGEQVILEGVPLHHGSVIPSYCQDSSNPNFVGGPTFGGDFPLDSPLSFPPGFTPQREFNSLAIDLPSGHPGCHWWNVTYETGATGSLQQCTGS